MPSKMGRAHSVIDWEFISLRNQKSIWKHEESKAKIHLVKTIIIFNLLG